MRKIFITIIFFIGLLSSANSQRIFHAGLLGGMSISQVLNDGLAHYSKLGFYGGGFISTEFSELWRGEIGFTYVMKGSKENFNNNNATYNGYKMTLGYIEFPFIAKVHSGKWDFEFGLSLGILVNSKEENWYSDAFSATPFQPVEFAGVLGVNYSFDDKWGLNLRSTNSILPIRYPTDNVYHPPLYGQRNIILTLAVRYFIQ